MNYLVRLFLLVLIGCTSSYPGEDKLDKIDKIVTKRLSHEYNLLPYGIGACWPDKCHAVEYAFIYQSTATISEARKLLLDTAHVIIESAESVKEFEQYLLNPPFTEKHIMFSIKFSEPCDMEGNAPQIKLASFTFGKLRYKIWNEEAYRYVSVYEETYEEALQRDNR